jgi:hypothetical protein
MITSLMIIKILTLIGSILTIEIVESLKRSKNKDTKESPRRNMRIISLTALFTIPLAVGGFLGLGIYLDNYPIFAAPCYVLMISLIVMEIIIGRYYNNRFWGNNNNRNYY